MADVGLRDWLGSKGYQVQWQGAGQPILAISPTGQQISIPASDYSLSGGTAYFDPGTAGGQQLVQSVMAPQSGLLATSPPSAPPPAPSGGGYVPGGAPSIYASQPPAPVSGVQNPNVPGEFTYTPISPMGQQAGTSLAAVLGQYGAGATVPLRSTIEGLGGQVQWQGQNQPITVTYQGAQYQVPPDVYQINSQGQAMVPAGWLQQNLETPTEQMNQAMQGTPMDPNFYNSIAQSIMGAYGQYQQQMQQMIGQLGSVGAQILNSYQQQFDQALAQMQAAEQENPNSDPAVQAAIQILRQQNAIDNQNLQEELNARGLSQSGIMAYEQGQLQQNLTNQEAQLVGNWVQQQQQNVFQATMAAAQMQSQFANNYANLMQQVETLPIQMDAQMAQQGFQLVSGLQQWAAQNMQQAWSSWQANQLEQAKMAQSWNEFMANYGLHSQEAQSLDQYRQGLLGHDVNMENIDAQRLSLEAGNQANRFNDTATSQAIGMATDTSQFPSRDAAIAYAQANSQAWAQQGVDMSKVYAAINAVYGSPNSSTIAP